VVLSSTWGHNLQLHTSVRWPEQSTIGLAVQMPLEGVSGTGSQNPPAHGEQSRLLPENPGSSGRQQGGIELEGRYLGFEQHKLHLSPMK